MIREQPIGTADQDRGKNADGMQLTFDTNSVESYRQFLQLRNSPVYHFRGNTAIVPDEYASRFGLELEVKQTEYRAIKQAFDYQRDITKTAIQKRKYAIFADCGLGKTLMLLEYARHAIKQCGGCLQLSATTVGGSNPSPRTGKNE